MTGERDHRRSIGIRLTRLFGLAPVIFGMTRADPDPAFEGRGLVVLLLLSVASACWLAWVAFPMFDVESVKRGLQDDRLEVAVLLGMAVTGGFLCGSQPSSPASVFVFVAAFTAGLRLSSAPALLVLGCAIASTLIGELTWNSSPMAAAAYCAGFGMTLLLGSNRREFFRRAAQTEQLLAQVERSREHELHNATLLERGRIAREMHDVLAHALAGLTIQIEATKALVDGGAPPEQISKRLTQADRLARDGLVEARRAVAALRGEETSLVADLRKLADDAARDGHIVELDLEETGPISEAATLTLERIAREALTNVRKHAPGQPVWVSLSSNESDLVLEIRNPGIVEDTQDSSTRDRVDSGLGASGGGFGIGGMIERAQGLGGTLHAAPIPGRDGIGDGWLVQLRLPLAVIEVAAIEGAAVESEEVTDR